MLKEHPVWIEGAVWPVLDPDRRPPDRVDVAVIGSGYTGLAAARALARAGASVAVFEARTLGWGASSRNGGMVLTGLKLEAAALTARYGLPAAQRMFAASLQAIDCVEQIVAEEHIDCAFERTGHLLLASKPAHFHAMEHEAELLWRSFGHTARAVPPGELRDEIGSDAYFGGLADEASAGVDPARYIAGLARAAMRAGAALYERTPVTDLAREAQGWRVTTPRGQLRAGAAIVATGAYTDRAFPALARRIVPLGSYIIATEPLPHGLAAMLSPRRRMMFDSNHLLHYFRLTPDRRMLFGGRARFFPETPRMVRESAAVLRRDMLRVFPKLAGARIDYAWGGTLDVTFDMMPHLGGRGGLYYALGYAGHGVAMATFLGSRLGARLAGEAAVTPFDDLPFRGAPLGMYDGRPWFLPLVGAWYRLLDWAT